MLYDAYQIQRDLTATPVALARLWSGWLDGLPRQWSDQPLLRQMSAAWRVAGRARLTHERPSFGVESVTTGGAVLPVSQEMVAATPFASLIRFSVPARNVRRPQVLLVTALAGHFSTLLRGTIAALVADHDVYATDWHNARDVPLAAGDFGLDEYIDHIIAFLERIGPGAHAVAVCQPCPATLAATALMAEAGNPARPRSLTLMAGPVDTRINPTPVNDLAHSQPLEWFERNVVTTVPGRYPGAGRRVYPGFLQVSAFMSMNLSRHIGQHVRLYDHLVHGRSNEARAITDFYDEYLAVLDMPAEFYLQTVDRVFQRHLLPKGELTWRDQPVRPEAIVDTSLLSVEGEKDDICGQGQTMAAHDLCRGLKRVRKRHHLQPGVGHYGVFSGSRWEQQIYPVVRNFIQANDA
ncbi:MAG: polyhydroxyalkanoate depolymerase [Actinomycetota bacterium]|nr:polyhydroxyalkanoate depolymerase [Actinomycetota bacterium]